MASAKTVENATLPFAPVVWINGYPGVGKLTIARELVKLYGDKDALLVDNHQLIDPVAAKFARDHPEYYPARRAERQKAFDRWVISATEQQRMIVFTDFQGDNESGRNVASEYVVAAEQSRRPFIPIYLICEQEENLKRVGSPQRMSSGTTKLVDVGFVKQIFSEEKIFVFDSPPGFQLDVTKLSPEESALRLLHYIKVTQHGRK